jgi:hypothetical protein
MNWLDILDQATPLIITAIVIPMLLAAGRAISKKFNTVMQQKYFNMAQNAVITAVAETMQTFVSALKKEGKWDAEAAKKAFEMSKLKAMQIMGVAVIQAMPEIVIDFEAWLTAQIEAATLTLKLEMEAGVAA